MCVWYFLSKEVPMTQSYYLFRSFSVIQSRQHQVHIVNALYSNCLLTCNRLNHAIAREKKKKVFEISKTHTSKQRMCNEPNDQAGTVEERWRSGVRQMTRCHENMLMEYRWGAVGRVLGCGETLKNIPLPPSLPPRKTLATIATFEYFYVFNW